jgi:alkylation response protein AidB-like acyl-CoA dehydrogenase
MNFDLSDDQELLRKTVREFAERELAPHSRKWDEAQEFPRSVFEKHKLLCAATESATPASTRASSSITSA